MNERVRDILRHPATIPAVVGVVSFGAGAAAGYFYAKHQQPEFDIVEDDDPQLRLDFGSVIDELDDKRKEKLVELEEKKSFHPPIPAERVLTERRVSEEDSEMLREYMESQKDEEDEDKYVDPPVPRDPRPDPSKISVDEGVIARVDRLIATGEEPTHDDFIRPIGFARDDDDDWDYTEELKTRVTSRPYILHKDEFFSDEMGYGQNTLTYYEGDDIMTSEDDTPIYDHKSVVGELKWGHGSDDPNVVYVRNERLQAEYEILRHEGLYSVEVLGLQIENNERVKDLKHSRTPGKFRME